MLPEPPLLQTPTVYCSIVQATFVANVKELHSLQMDMGNCMRVRDHKWLAFLRHSPGHCCATHEPYLDHLLLILFCSQGCLEMCKRRRHLSLEVRLDGKLTLGKFKKVLQLHSHAQKVQHVMVGTTPFL